LHGALRESQGFVVIVFAKSNVGQRQEGLQVSGVELEGASPIGLGVGFIFGLGCVDAEEVVYFRVIGSEALQGLERVLRFSGVAYAQGVHGLAKLLLGFGRQSGHARGERGVFGGERLQFENQLRRVSRLGVDLQSGGQIAGSDDANVIFGRGHVAEMRQIGVRA
jgi:hypothetical protein